MKPFLAAFVIAAVTPLAAAQQQPARPNPADPAAPIPAAKYESAFEGYVSYREQELARWRDVNDEVARIGGHMGMFGGGGHAGHGAAKPGPSKPPPGQPAAAPSRKPAGQPPARGAPQGPESGHQGH